MNIREAVSSFVSIEVNASTIALEIINAGMTPEQDYSADLQTVVARIAANVLSSMLSLSSVKEGDLTLNYDREGILKRLLYLAKSYGFSDLIAQHSPSISSPKVW
jgi:hypothetical protein